jgi:transposase
MSKPVAVAWRETTGELEARYRAERDLERRKRLGALWRVRAGDRVADAGRMVGVGGRTVERWLGWYRVGGRTVERWLGWYRVGGLAEVLRRVPGHGATGQPHRLTAEQQAGLLARCAAGEVRTFEEARAWVEAAYGVAYRPGGFYTSLHRLGVRPKVPRPVAGRADPARREAWQQGG